MIFELLTCSGYILAFLVVAIGVCGVNPFDDGSLK